MKMFKPFAVVSALLFSVSPSLAQQQPVQWRYSFNPNGIATATYPGEIVVNGQTTANDTTTFVLPTVDGERVEVRKDSAPLNYGDTRAAFVVQQRDTAELPFNGIAPGAVFQFASTGNGSVNADSQFSASIWSGLYSFMRKTGDGSGHSFTATGEVGPYGTGLYNELGGFQGEMTNTGSLNATISLLEGVVKDSPDGGTNNFPTKMSGATLRLAKWNQSAFDSNSIVVTSEGSVAPDSIIYTFNNTGFNRWKNGLNFSTAVFTTGRAAIFPNNTVLSWMDSAASATPIIGVSNADVTYIRQAASASFTQVQNFAGTPIATFQTGRTTFDRIALLTPGTFATLPACDGTITGAVATVTDSNSATFNAVMAGGGANTVLAFCNGTAWTVH